VAKSGTNSWHGTAFEFFRNAQLNANDFFYNRDNPDSRNHRQVLNQNQFGGVLGGPIKKDKLFIFGSYQGTRQRNAVDTAGNSAISQYPIVPAGDRTSPAFVSALIAANCQLPSFGPPGPNGVLPCSATSVSPVALKMLQVKNADGSYYFPTHTTFGDTLNLSSPVF